LTSSELLGKLADDTITNRLVFSDRGLSNSNVHVLPLPMAVDETKTQITEACAKIGHDILQKE
jgi:hypothetical protein